MALKDYPIIFGSTTLPLADSLWKEDYSNIQNVNVSEVGTDVVQYTRLGKLKVKLSYTLFASYASIFEAAAFGGETIMVKIFDIATSAYKEHEMRMDGYSKEPVQGSQLLTGMNGMWKYSFTLIEM